MKWLRRLFQSRGRRLPKYGDEGTPYLAYTYFDTAANEEIIIQLLCTCGWNVSGFKSEVEGTYWCEHCDRICSEGLPTCYFCGNLANADVEAIRAQYEDQTREEDEE